MESMDEQSDYLWKSKDGSLCVRKLSGTERMFVLLNQLMFGQNCPFVGATVSLQRRSFSCKKQSFSFEELQKRAVDAFCQTRWKYPTVAGRVANGDTAVYKANSKDEVEEWANRTVTVMKQDGGWLDLRENLSRSSPMPTKYGDYCVVYLLVRPEEAALPEITTFDVLLHMHHVFADGSGIRSILNEFLARLAAPLPAKDIVWGQEIERLHPAALLLDKQEDENAINGDLTPKGKNRFKGMFESDIGLPLYRPDLLRPDPKLRGSLLISHTFEDPSFLSQLLAVGRKHGVKLTALLQTAMLRAVYNVSDPKPSSEGKYTNPGITDLRTNHLISPYNERNLYVNIAVSSSPIEAPIKMIESNDFWMLAAHLADQWASIKNKSGFLKTADKDAQSMVAALERSVKEAEEKSRTFTNATTAKPKTCPYFVSDPPGENQLSKTYSVFGHEGLHFELESYQLATDQTQATVSARSHSWNGRLTLCLVFNALRNPKEKMQEFLSEWVRIVEEMEREF